MKNNEILFARKSEDVKIPSKRVEDAGYDIYAYFEEDSLTVKAHETVLIPTGVYTAVSNDWVIMIKDRGSNGSVGIQTASGIVDSGFRNEIMVVITNTNDKDVVISKDVNRVLKLDSVIMYPYSKGIAQLLVLPVPKMEVKEISLEELQSIKSERGLGMLGSSGK